MPESQETLAGILLSAFRVLREHELWILEQQMRLDAAMEYLSLHPQFSNLLSQKSAAAPLPADGDHRSPSLRIIDSTLGQLQRKFPFLDS